MDLYGMEFSWCLLVVIHGTDKNIEFKDVFLEEVMHGTDRNIEFKW